jgi:pimeloyl-ACP methyl ester carboxylesterase
MTRLALAGGISALLLLEVSLRAREAGWRDPSKHQVKFITVDRGVQLEVLDWGGAGRAIVLLTGSGNTAHVFDGFAPKLKEFSHVYAITRRGFGNSSRPSTGYDDQRLADDALRVIDALHLDHPLLAGHSMAGGEMTTIGRQHSERISGLVYLDATADPAGDSSMSDPEFVAALEKLPTAMRQPAKLDYSSLQGFQGSLRRANMGVFPESEIRQLFNIQQDGSLGPYIASNSDINAAIGRGQIKRDYSYIRVPVLVFIDYPQFPDDPQRQSGYQPVDAGERAAMTAYTRVAMKRIGARTETLKRSVPNARVLELPGAGHYVFLTHEAVVLREVHAFLSATRSQPR